MAVSFENFKWFMIGFGKLSYKVAFCQTSCLYPYELLFELSVSSELLFELSAFQNF